MESFQTTTLTPTYTDNPTWSYAGSSADDVARAVQTSASISRDVTGDVSTETPGTVTWTSDWPDDGSDPGTIWRLMWVTFTEVLLENKKDFLLYASLGSLGVILIAVTVVAIWAHKCRRKPHTDLLRYIQAYEAQESMVNNNDQTPDRETLNSRPTTYADTRDPASFHRNASSSNPSTSSQSQIPQSPNHSTPRAVTWTKNGVSYVTVGGLVNPPSVLKVPTMQTPTHCCCGRHAPRNMAGYAGEAPGMSQPSAPPPELGQQQRGWDHNQARSVAFEAVQRRTELYQHRQEGQHGAVPVHVDMHNSAGPMVSAYRF